MRRPVGSSSMVWLRVWIGPVLKELLYHGHTHNWHIPGAVLVCNSRTSTAPAIYLHLLPTICPPPPPLVGWDHWMSNVDVCLHACLHNIVCVCVCVLAIFIRLFVDISIQWYSVHGKGTLAFVFVVLHGYRFLLWEIVGDFWYDCLVAMWHVAAMTMPIPGPTTIHRKPAFGKLKGCSAIRKWYKE